MIRLISFLIPFVMGGFVMAGGSSPPSDGQERYIDTLHLIDAESGEILKSFSSYTLLDLAPYSGRKLDFQVEASRAEVASAELQWNSNSPVRSEVRPFRLWGQAGASTGELSQGPHTIGAKVFDGPSSDGDLLQELRVSVYLQVTNEDGGGGDDGENGGGGGGRRSRPVFPAEPSQVERLSKPIVVKAGQTFDAKGKGYYATYDSCSQEEGMRPCFILEKGAKLINAHMMRCPDGIHTKGDNVIIDRVVFHAVCEDAITVRNNHVTIRNSWFRGGQDKTLQLSSGSGIKVQNNRFLNSVRPVKSGTSTSNILVEDNEFWNIRSDNLIQDKGSATYRNNYTDGTNCQMRAKNGAVVTDGGGNVGYNVKKRDSSCVESGGKIVR